MSIIFRLTWKELLRKRVLLLTLIMTLAFLIAFWFIASSIGGGNELGGLNDSNNVQLLEKFSRGLFIVNLGFFFGSFVVAFLSIFSSSSVISGEAEQGVMQAMLPRPLVRWQWYAGRWLGYVSFGMIYALALYSAVLIIAGMHASVPREWGSLVIAYLLFASVVPLLVSVSMLGSGYLSAIGNGVLMTMLYGGGWLGGMIDKVSSQLDSLGAVIDHTLTNVSGLLSLAMPADGLQRIMMDRLYNFTALQEFYNPATGGIIAIFGIGTAPSNTFLWYALFYMLSALLLGIWRFQRKDL